jgi:hypothetical protein
MREFILALALLPVAWVILVILLSLGDLVS